jgi:hypothetical protein
MYFSKKTAERFDIPAVKSNSASGLTASDMRMRDDGYYVEEVAAVL